MSNFQNSNNSSSGVKILRWDQWPLAITVIVALLITVWSLSSYLWDKYRVVRDVQNFYWMARAQDPQLFAVDYLYLSSDTINIEVNFWGFYLLLHPLSLGYGLIFYLASAAVDYIWLTKLSAIILVLICVVYLFKVGQSLRDTLTGMSLSLIFVFFILASPLSISLASGLQRAFALPLLIIFAYYLVRHRYIGAAISIFVSALVYLPNLPLMVLAYAFSMLKVERSKKISVTPSWAKLLPYGSALLVSAALVLLALAARQGMLSAPPTEFVTRISPEQVPVSNDPSFQTSGSMPLFIGFPFLGRVGVFDTGGDVTNFLVMLTVAFLVFKVVGSKSVRQVPPAVWWLLVAGFIMYGVSLFFVLKLSSFALYLPSRYTRSTTFLLLVFYLGLNWVDFSLRFPSWMRKNSRLLVFFVLSLGLAFGLVYVISPTRALLIPTFWFLGLLACGVFTLLGSSLLLWLSAHLAHLKPSVGWSGLLATGFVVLLLGTIYIRVLGVKTTNPAQDERNIYEFVAKLPKDTVLAGNPDIMTNVPLFSKRSVLFRELFPRTDAPIVEYFDVQYAESVEPVVNFCRRYQIGYLVLDTRDYSPAYLAKEEFFYQPWNERIVDLVSDRSNFVLTRLQPVYSSGPFAVIKCDVEMNSKLSSAD